MPNQPMREEADPYYIKDVDIVNVACTRWLMKRGLNYSFRELIRNGVVTSYNRKTAKARREQREDDRVSEEFNLE